MSKLLKGLLKKEMIQDLTDVKDIVLVDSSRLKAQEAWDLRGRLAKSGLRMRVVKNSLAAMALRENGLEGLDSFFEGPVTLVYGDASAGGIVRTLEDWNKKATPVVYKGGLLDGSVGEASDVKAWALLPTREEMLSQVLGVFLAPASSIAGLMHSQLATFPNLVAAHIEKLEKEQEGAGAQA